jgi:perosamine synthetase
VRAPLPVAAPALVGRELEYVTDCLNTTWISSTGDYIERFECAFADFCAVEHAISCCNGTSALHLALLALGAEAGDEVIVPSLTYVASVNAIRYCGAKPVLVDTETQTWTLDTEALASLVTPRTKGIVAVHLYGHPVDLDPVLALAREHGLFVLEDAAEAHGARYKGRVVGSLGDCAMFSFYGNKIVTTGEGGMVVTDDGELAAKLRLLRGQGQDPARRYWFPVVGYNYRLTNVAAAIGLAQMERIDWHVARRREIAKWYRDELEGDERFLFSPEADWAESSYWMSSILLTDAAPRSRDEVASALAANGVDTRPFFYPVHTLPPYAELASNRSFPVSEALAQRGLNLPSSALLSRDDVACVCAALRTAVAAG